MFESIVRNLPGCSVHASAILRKQLVEATKSTVEQKNSISKAAKMALINANQSKTFEQLDKMMEEILGNDIPDVCTFKFGISPKIAVSSKSDRNIAMGLANNEPMPNSQSFTRTRDHHCCAGATATIHHSNGRHHRIHSNACNLL